MLLDEPELPELPDDPDDPDEPDEALRPDCPLLLEPDMPPEFSLLPRSLVDDPLTFPELPDVPLMLPERPDVPLMPPERFDSFSIREDPLLLPEDPTFRSLSGELAELPPTPPVLEPLDEACRSRSDAECPSPCDELPRSRFELPDEALLSLWPLFDEPEVFRSRSAIYKFLQSRWTSSGARHAASPRASSG